jgi:hypothetical protein
MVMLTTHSLKLCGDITVIYFVTAIGLTPGGSSTAHIYLHTISTQNTENGTYITIRILKLATEHII